MIDMRIHIVVCHHHHHHRLYVNTCIFSLEILRLKKGIHDAFLHEKAYEGRFLLIKLTEPRGNSIFIQSRI